MANPEPYYRADLARIHHLGFGFHAEACAPGILALLEPVRGGLVVELGCGSGLLTRHLVDAGHAVGAQEIRQLVLPDDPIPEADAIVSVGHALSYLPTADAIDRALISAAGSLRPGGVFAIDLCDLTYVEAQHVPDVKTWIEDDWALITRRSAPTPDTFIREMTMFTRNDDATWRRDDERHDNILIDTSRVPPLLAEHGVDATVGSAFGSEKLPDGLHTVIGTRRREGPSG
jgi:SAM-dependent methyltransferase